MPLKCKQLQYIFRQTNKEPQLKQEIHFSRKPVDPVALYPVHNKHSPPNAAPSPGEN